METIADVKRSLILAVTVMMLLLLSSVAINDSWRINNEAAAECITTIGIVTRLFLLFFGTFFIYFLSFRIGLPFKYRLTVSFAPHFYWFLHQFFMHALLYPLMEAIYIIFNPVFIFFIAWGFFQAGLSEILFRNLLSRHAARDKNVKKKAAVMAIAGIAVMTVAAIFSITIIDNYRALYRLIFL